VRRTDPGNPEVCNIYTIHRCFSPPDVLAWADQGCRTAGIGCIDCKKALFKEMMKELDPIRERARELEGHTDRVNDFLAESARDCKALAESTMDDVRRLTGIR